jgi:hypothetical protein
MLRAVSRLKKPCGIMKPRRRRCTPTRSGCGPSVWRANRRLRRSDLTRTWSLASAAIKRFYFWPGNFTGTCGVVLMTRGLPSAWVRSLRISDSRTRKNFSASICAALVDGDLLIWVEAPSPKIQSTKWEHGTGKEDRMVRCGVVGRGPGKFWWRFRRRPAPQGSSRAR